MGRIEGAVPLLHESKHPLPAVQAERVEAKHFEGDVARREGMGSLAAIDEITMVCAPDLMTLAENGSDAHIRDLQGKMIAHCENARDRIAILDAPPGLMPQLPKPFLPISWIVSSNPGLIMEKAITTI